MLDQNKVRESIARLNDTVFSEVLVDSKDFDKEKDKFAQQVVARKDREFYENWSKEVVARAKIKLNDNVLAEETEEGSGAMPMPSGPVSEEI